MGRPLWRLWESVRATWDDSLKGCQLPAQDRREEERCADTPVSNRQRVSTRGIERTGLTTQQRASAEEAYRNELERNGRLAEGADSNTQTGHTEKREPGPSLMIHLIDVQPNGLDVPPDQPVAARGISFPGTDREERRVEYVVNTTWLRENFGDDVLEDEMEGDDGVGTLGRRLTRPASPTRSSARRVTRTCPGISRRGSGRGPRVNSSRVRHATDSAPTGQLPRTTRH